MTDLLIATTNPVKLREIESWLLGVPFRLLTLADVRAMEPPQETGQSFAENARLKARYYATATRILTVAEDSGLVIDALGGRPGIESARYAGGDQVAYPDKFARIYSELGNVAGSDNRARFVCAVALAQDDRILFETEGIVEGRIAPAPSGQGDFAYDPIFFYPPFGCTLAEAGDRKAAVSHRGAAFRQLATYLRTARI